MCHGLKNAVVLEIKRKAETSILTVDDLLMDLREVLRKFTDPEIGGNELLECLLCIAESDWHSANNGRTTAGIWLAMKLRPYGMTVRLRSD